MRLAVFCGSILWLVMVLSPALLAAERPNLLIVLIDDFGWGDINVFGGAGVATPCMDRLAREGTRFKQFYVASPICSPSRCGWITGQFPGRWRISSYLQTRAGNRECEQADFLDPAAPSFVRLLQSVGYATAHIGKWHLGGGRDVTDAPPFAAYGYDLGLGTYESPEPAAALGLKSVPWSDKTEPQQVPRHDRTRWMVDETLAFVKRNAARPWLVNLWLDDTHTPFRPSPEQNRDLVGAGTPAYRAVLHETDRQIGRLLDGLRALNLEANTLVLLAGDNGPQPSFNRARTNGLRGMKWSLYEGGIRTPFLVRWPGHVPADRVNDTTVVGAVDLLQTLCALATTPLSPEMAGDGEDVSAALFGKPHVRTKPLYWEYGRKPPIEGAGLPAFPYPDEPESKSPNIAMREGDWKLLINADGSGVELYNLAKDRNETHNLADAEPDIAKKLSTLALTWRRSLP